MRVVVTGATGNVGTSVVDQLVRESRVDSVVGVARRRPQWERDGVTWVAADVRHDDLAPVFRGADAVVHLAWAFQPSHRPRETWRTNVVGSEEVLRAADDAAVPTLVVASSVGAYSPNDSDTRVDESWPTHGWPAAAYCREKAYVERLLDAFASEHPTTRVVRMRPGFLFKDEAAPEQMRIFGGPLVPSRLIGKTGLPLVPALPGLRFQALHTEDVARAYVLATLGDASGAFNLAAEPVVDNAVLAGVFDGRSVPFPASVARGLLAAAWHARIVPAPPPLFDYLLHIPLMDVSRAHAELGWRPERSAVEALQALRAGLAQPDGFATPPLHG